MDYLVVFVLSCVCCRLSGRNFVTFEQFLFELWVIIFPEGKSYFEMQTLSAFLNMGFYPLVVVIRGEWREIRIFTFFVIKSIKPYLRETCVVTK